jgi:hypothetical protein
MKKTFEEVWKSMEEKNNYYKELEEAREKDRLAMKEEAFWSNIIQRRIYNQRPDVVARRKELQKIFLSNPENIARYYAKQKEYQRRPEVKARKKEYLQRPDVIARKKEYYSRPDVKSKQRERARLYYRSKKQKQIELLMAKADQAVKESGVKQDVKPTL